MSIHLGVKEGLSLLEQNSEMEMILERALNGAGHFIALGRPGEALGAGRLPATEGAWQDNVALLINAAVLCIVIPSANPGTQWEIRRIVQSGHLGKCCIVMPSAIGKKSSADDWRAARDALADVLRLPEYRETGGNVSIFCQHRFGPSVSEAIAMGIQALFPELPRWDVDAGPS